MKQLLAIFVCVSACALSVFPQSTISPHERLILHNSVTETARHCRKYVTPSGTVDVAACAADPTTVYFTYTNHNLRTNAGGDWQASAMGDTGIPPAPANFIALSNDSTAPSTSDTTLASEITTNGFARAQASYTHTPGTASYLLDHVFVPTATQSVRKAAIFNASTSGVLFAEATLVPVTLNVSATDPGDTLEIRWTINF